MKDDNRLLKVSIINAILGVAHSVLFYFVVDLIWKDLRDKITEKVINEPLSEMTYALVAGMFMAFIYLCTIGILYLLVVLMVQLAIWGVSVVNIGAIFYGIIVCILSKKWSLEKPQRCTACFLVDYEIKLWLHSASYIVYTVFSIYLALGGNTVYDLDKWKVMCFFYLAQMVLTALFLSDMYAMSLLPAKKRRNKEN